MRIKTLFLLIIFLLAACGNPQTSLPAGDDFPTRDWASADPASKGMDAALLAEAVAYVEANDIALHSLLVIRHGAIVSETYFSPYKADTLHELYSVTKSFTATLVGIAIDQGKLQDVNQPVLGFFPELEFANLDEGKKGMRVEDLLTMTSGLAWEEGDAFYRRMYMSADWVKMVMDLPVIAAPGSEFVYCSGCSHVLSGILRQITGKPLEAYAQANLFKPLGITRYAWESGSQGNSIGGWGLSLAPRDMAKLGYLYLHKGQWEGKQVVSAEWVAAATQRHVITEGENGYGYQWWIYPELGGYAALGLYGQTVFVAPEQDLIVVSTAQVSDHEVIFSLIENFILKAVIEP